MTARNCRNRKNDQIFNFQMVPEQFCQKINQINLFFSFTFKQQKEDKTVLESL